MTHALPWCLGRRRWWGGWRWRLALVTVWRLRPYTGVPVGCESLGGVPLVASIALLQVKFNQPRPMCLHNHTIGSPQMPAEVPGAAVTTYWAGKIAVDISPSGHCQHQVRAVHWATSALCTTGECKSQISRRSEVLTLCAFRNECELRSALHLTGTTLGSRALQTPAYTSPTGGCSVVLHWR